MFQALKKVLYFPLAYYFRFFAKIKLARWKPRIIVVTGSSGKTTLLHLIEAQVGRLVRYSHHANSSYGIPFDILGLERKTLMVYEWVGLFLKTPFLAFSSAPKQKIYVVEADCDRPGEGQFLSSLLKPEVTIWLSSSRTHSMNFDKLVEQGKFPNVEQAIAYEYGYFLEATSKLVIVNSDSELINKQLSRTGVEKIGISNKSLRKYQVSKDGSVFRIGDETYKFKFLLPEAVFYSILAVIRLVEYMNLPFDPSFGELDVPPGRSSIFKAIKNTTIVDSCYNANLSSMTEIIRMFNKLPSNKKWVVVGDMLEQGAAEREEHEKLAESINRGNYQKIILLGPRVSKYTYPKVKEQQRAVKFLSPKEVLEYILENLDGEETILFKGARFMEGIIENLLLNKSDAAKLSRREKAWETRRKKWGL